MMPQRFDDYSEGGANGAAAWVIELVARKRSAPLSDYFDELTVSDTRLHQVLGQPCQA
jgi:hypothetical protein